MKETVAVFGTAQPRYRQVKDHVVELINTGELNPHDRVPSENDLVKSLGVARMTAHRTRIRCGDRYFCTAARSG